MNGLAMRQCRAFSIADDSLIAPSHSEGSNTKNGVLCPNVSISSNLELELHSSDCLSRLNERQLLNVCVEVSRQNLRVPGLDGLEECVVDEDILVLRLHHVIALCPKAGHVTIDIDCLFVSNSLQHCIDHYDGPSPTHASATTASHLCYPMR